MYGVAGNSKRGRKVITADPAHNADIGVAVIQVRYRIAVNRQSCGSPAYICNTNHILPISSTCRCTGNGVRFTPYRIIADNSAGITVASVNSIKPGHIFSTGVVAGNPPDIIILTGNVPETVQHYWNNNGTCIVKIKSHFWCT